MQALPPTCRSVRLRPRLGVARVGWGWEWWTGDRLAVSLRQDRELIPSSEAERCFHMFLLPVLGYVSKRRSVSCIAPTADLLAEPTFLYYLELPSSSVLASACCSSCFFLFLLCRCSFFFCFPSSILSILCLLSWWTARCQQSVTAVELMVYCCCRRYSGEVPLMGRRAYIENIATSQ